MWSDVIVRTSLKELPGDNVEKIRRRQGFLQNHRRSDSPYGIDEYVRRGNEVCQLD